MSSPFVAEVQLQARVRTVQVDAEVDEAGYKPREVANIVHAVSMLAAGWTYAVGNL